MSTITSLPTPPSRQDPSNFNDRADAFLGALPTFVTETNTVAAEVNSSANAVIAATNVTKWISGNTYSQGAVVWSPINGLGYRRITAIGSGTTDPSLDTTNYRQVNGTGDVSTSGNQTISGVKVFNDNLGLGVTPSAWNSSFKSFDIGGGSIYSYLTSGLNFSQNTFFSAGGAFTYKNTGTATRYEQNAGTHAWFTAPSGTAGNTISFTQAMTLDASGNLLVGTSSNVNPSSRISIGYIGGSNLYGMTFRPSEDNTTSLYFTNAAGGQIGFISHSTTTTAYNTSSDYRLKHDIAPMRNAMQRVVALNPVTYKWNADGSSGEGFIAHELQAIIPECVTGKKDEVDADGKPVYQGIDTSFLVATLVAAIQEQQAIIADLTARVTQLESR